MFKDFTSFLWWLKLGTLVNLYFLIYTFARPVTHGDAHIIIPARILFAVLAYRCLFPVQYKNQVVLPIFVHLSDAPAGYLF